MSSGFAFSEECLLCDPDVPRITSLKSLSKVMVMGHCGSIARTPETGLGF